MKLHRFAFGALGLAGAALTIAACAGDAVDGATGSSASAGPQQVPARPAVPGRQQLSGHVTAEMAQAPLAGRLPAAKQLTLSIALKVRDPQALADAVAQVSDPNSPSYRQYLTPDQFGERFGASAADYDAVTSWARGQNLSVDVHPNRLVANVTGTVADIEAALHVHLNAAIRPDGSEFHLPDAEPSIDLSVPIQHISNLQNYVVPRHADHGSGPGGSRQGADFRDAYASGTGLTGAGQTIGIFMFDGFSQSDLDAYAAASGLPTPPAVQIVEGNGNTGTSVGLEGDLDVQMSFSMAPGAQIVAFTGTDADLILTNMTKSPRIKQLTSSWFWGNTAAQFQAEETLQQELALQGQSFFQATGDNGAYTAHNGPGSTDLRESPYITLVGGTALTLNGASFVSERAWDDSSGGVLANGGTAGMPIPYYQAGLANAANQASSVLRNAPDVSAEASDVAIYVNGAVSHVGGTSAATPLWAGFMALVNQQAAASDLGSVGFANPTLYAVAASSKYGSAFHDVTTGSCPCDVSAAACALEGGAASYNATSGYDLCTGLGSPQVGLINAIANVHASKATPAMASLNGVLHAAYIANNSSNDLLHISSSDGVNWTSESLIGNHASGAGPSLAAFDGQLHMAYIANNSSNELLHVTSTDGLTWGTETVVAGHASKAAPSLAVFNNRLYMAYIANNSSNDLLFISTADGVTWSTETVVAGHASGAAPSLAVFNNRLYMAYIANNSSNDLLFISTADGVTWSTETVVAGHASKAGPSLAVFNNKLYMSYIANNSSNELLFLSTADGVTWGAEALVAGHASGAGPSATSFNGALRLAYIANNSTDTLLRVSSTDGATWGTETAW